MLGSSSQPINGSSAGRDIFPTFNKVALSPWAALIGITIYFLATRRDPLVAPTERNVAESGVEFIEEQIVMQTIGRD